MKLDKTRAVFLSVLCAGSCHCLAMAADCDPALPRYDHIVIVVMENETDIDVIGRSDLAPFTNELAAGGALLSGSYGCEHPSQPNYLDLFSGSDQNVYSDSIPTNTPFSTDNLGAQMLRSGLSFAGYSEYLPYTGALVEKAAAPESEPGTPDYARKHNPWSNWQNDEFPAGPDNKGSNYLPSGVNQSFSEFERIGADADYSELPTISFVIPSQQHDDHGVATLRGLEDHPKGEQLIIDGDAWLREHLSAYAAWAGAHNSLLILTYDEDDFSSVNRIPTVFYGAHIAPGVYSEEQHQSWTSVASSDRAPASVPIYRPVRGVNHWNILRTLEDIYGLDYAGAACRVSPITDIFALRPDQQT